jgi:hypothetical protein
VAPGTTARFSHFDDQSRDHSPPSVLLRRLRAPLGYSVASFFQTVRSLHVGGLVKLGSAPGRPSSLAFGVPCSQGLSFVVELAALGEC